MTRDRDKHYQTLGIPREASAEQIKRSYRSRVKACHPDQFPSGSEAHAEAEERIRAVNAAYAVLSNPRKRASYDAKLSKQPSPHSEPEPQRCDKCGKATGYWQTGKNVALCRASRGQPRKFLRKPPSARRGVLPPTAA